MKHPFLIFSIIGFQIVNAQNPVFTNNWIGSSPSSNSRETKMFVYLLEFPNQLFHVTYMKGQDLTMITSFDLRKMKATDSSLVLSTYSEDQMDSVFKINYLPRTQRDSLVVIAGQDTLYSIDDPRGLMKYSAFDYQNYSYFLRKKGEEEFISVPSLGNFELPIRLDAELFCRIEIQSKIMLLEKRLVQQKLSAFYFKGKNVESTFYENPQQVIYSYFQSFHSGGDQFIFNELTKRKLKKYIGVSTYNKLRIIGLASD